MSAKHYTVESYIKGSKLLLIKKHLEDGLYTLIDESNKMHKPMPNVSMDTIDDVLDSTSRKFIRTPYPNGDQRVRFYSDRKRRSKTCIIM
jgi:hypothetical protein